MTCKSRECGCPCQITGLAHIGVFVADMSASKEFYTNVLGFECYHEAQLPGDDAPTKLAFLRCGTCEVELVAIPGYEKRADGPIDHIALSVSDIDAMAACLKGQGIVFDTQRPNELPMVFDKGVKCIFFRGPDGERIELSEVL